MIYKGTEARFTIDLEAEGFSMDEHDFDIEVVSPKGSVKGSKRAGKRADSEVVIFKDTDIDSSDSDDGVWCAIAETKNLSVGELRVIATCYIPDANANDGIRIEVAPSSLDRLVNP